MSKLDVFDFDKVCRTCLSTKQLKSLYSKLINKDNLAEMLMICTPVEYYENDGLPIHICTDCISEINQSYKFALKCRESDEKLRIHFRNLLPDHQIHYSETSNDTNYKSDTDISEIQNPEVATKNDIIIHEILIENPPTEMPIKENNNKINENTDKQAQIKRKSIKEGIKLPERPYTCTVCHKSFKRKDHLKTHSRTHNDDKQYGCILCDKAFNDKTKLNSHMQMHTGNKSFSCTTCNCSFNVKSNLTRHMRTHTKEKIYSCTVCGSKFSENMHLKRHMRMHTGEKPYKCNVCQNGFHRRDILNNHMRTHTGEKPYVCAICNKTFNHQHHLNNHVRTHTGEKPFPCTICKMFFQRKDSLKNHIRKQHTKIYT